MVEEEELTSMLSYQYAFMIARVLCWWYVGIVVGCRSDRGGAAWKFEDGWSAKHVIFDVLAVRSGTSLLRRINDYTITIYELQYVTDHNDVQKRRTLTNSIDINYSYGSVCLSHP